MPTETAPSTRELGPQAVSVLARTGLPIRPLPQKYYTPAEANIPSHKSVKVVHRPVLIAPPAPPVAVNVNDLPLSDIIDDTEPEPESQELIDPKQTLDGFALLQATGMTLPDDGRTITLPERNFKAVVGEDLTFFTGLVYLDLSENFLPLEPFGVLPALEELRLACNNIHEIGDIPPNQGHFERLLRLDLSYNSLTLRSVQVLDAMPSLVELDLCGNNLRGLPLDMFRFPCLEKLLLEHNKIDDNGVFVTLCCMKRLRHVSLAYNFLSSVAPACCYEGFFKFLQHLDVSFNYFGDEESVQPLVQLPRLKTVVLYGNPLLGPTGEDALQTRIEDLVNLALDVRVSQNKEEIEFITEVPRQRTLKKGVPSGRQMTYRDFEVVAVDEGEISKLTRDWRAEGKKTMFAEAVAVARRHVASRAGGDGHQHDAGAGPDNTFITGGGAGVGVGGGSVAGHSLSSNSRSTINKASAAAHSMDAIAEDIMGHVAKEMGIGQATSAELLMLRDKASIRDSLVSRMDLDEQEQRQHQFSSFRHASSNSPEADEDAAALGAPIADTLPPQLFSEAFGKDPEQKLSSQPVPLVTAVAALKFAVSNPLTSYNEVPGRGFLPPKNYVQPTAASQNRRLPRNKASSARAGSEDQAALDNVADVQGRIQRGLPEPADGRLRRDATREESLEQMDEVLESLNSSTERIVHHKGDKKAAEEFELMDYFARPSTGLNNLLSLVNEVIDDLDGK